MVRPCVRLPVRVARLRGDAAWLVPRRQRSRQRRRTGFSYCSRSSCCPTSGCCGTGSCSTPGGRTKCCGSDPTAGSGNRRGRRCGSCPGNRRRCRTASSPTRPQRAGLVVEAGAVEVARTARADDKALAGQVVTRKEDRAGAGTPVAAAAPPIGVIAAVAVVVAAVAVVVAIVAVPAAATIRRPAEFARRRYLVVSPSPAATGIRRGRG